MGESFLSPLLIRAKDELVVSFITPPSGNTWTMTSFPPSLEILSHVQRQQRWVAGGHGAVCATMTSLTNKRVMVTVAILKVYSRMLTGPRLANPRVNIHLQVDRLSTWNEALATAMRREGGKSEGKHHLHTIETNFRRAKRA